MKKLLVLILSVFLILQSIPIIASEDQYKDSAYSDPISAGTINTVTYVRWGRSELFAAMGLVGPGTKMDVYEYDKEWVMVLYDTYIQQGYTTYAHSFYGFVKRSDITCDPELEGDKSAKAETGPGKRKGKKPKTPKKTKESAEDETTLPEDTKSEEPEDEEDVKDASENEPDSTVEISDEEYDWIIRTPGMCNVTIPFKEAIFTCSFALMAQKAGGLGPSSDPAFNHGMHTPYAATAFFGMVAPMQDMLDNMGAGGFLSGSGGIKITGQAGGSTFYIDTASLDPALVNFSVKLMATSTLDPKITDGNITTNIAPISTTQEFPLPVQLKKTGKGYKFILPGMKPGGGDLEFPAVLEKTFSDPDKWEKAAKEADRRRKEAERRRKEMQKQMEQQMKEELAQKEKEKDQNPSEKTDLLTDENGNPIPLAPLVPSEDTDTTGNSGSDSDDIDLAPLVPAEDTGKSGSSGGDSDDIDLAPLVPADDEGKSENSGGDSDDIDLAPLWPTEDESISDFPSSNP